MHLIHWLPTAVKIQNEEGEMLITAGMISINLISQSIDRKSIGNYWGSQLIMEEP